MKTLVIGTQPGNGIGAAFVDGGEFDELHTPTIDDLSVTNRMSISRYLREHGPFDEIVYCAGVNTLGWAKDADLSWLDNHMSVNAYGLVLVMGIHESLFPHYSGSVVAIVSDASETPMRGSIAYCMSKAAEAMAVRCLSRELSPRWRVNGVSPGMVDGTPMSDRTDRTVPVFRGWTEEQTHDYEMASNPIKRRVTKEEVAETMMFVLRGPGALTGELVKINGGK